jgi:hypothetical protein
MMLFLCLLLWLLLLLLTLLLLLACIVCTPTLLVLGAREKVRFLQHNQCNSNDMRLKVQCRQSLNTDRAAAWLSAAWTGRAGSCRC